MRHSGVEDGSHIYDMRRGPANVERGSGRLALRFERLGVEIPFGHDRLSLGACREQLERSLALLG
jgi:hypothetical protein